MRLVTEPMTPRDERKFIAFWQQGLSHEAMAQRLGYPVGTIKSRAHRLQQQGVIQSRGRGGRPGLVPVQTPVQATDTGAVHSVATGAVQTFDTGAVQRLDRLEEELQGVRYIVQSLVERLDHPPVQTPVQITTLPPYPKGKAVRWNLWILDAMRDELAALAAERDISPSQLVQELLWKALSDCRSSPP
jgi:transposase